MFDQTFDEGPRRYASKERNLKCLLSRGQRSEASPEEPSSLWQRKLSGPYRVKPVCSQSAPNTL